MDSVGLYQWGFNIDLCLLPRERHKIQEFYKYLCMLLNIYGFDGWLDILPNNAFGKMLNLW